MRRWVFLVALLAGAMLPSAASGAVLVPLASPSDWVSTPINATSPPGDPRLFVVERGGGIRIVEGGVLKEAPFLTVPNVDTEVERGLLSMAFSPDYASSGLFYVFTVAKEAGEFGATPGELQIVEYRRSASNPNLADPNSARLVLGIPHTAGNHNGGQLAFGPDGFLYITIGDNATSSNAQTLGNDYGKVLRIDPSPVGGVGFEVPDSNPFLGSAHPEIYALGMRNPYRASFAPDGRLIVADVGEGAWEEVNAGVFSGANLGWPICEGDCSPAHPELTDPFFQYPHPPGPEGTTGCAIIGGYVVRDKTLSGLTGRYLYGDLCRTDLRTIDLAVPSGDPRPAGLTLPNPGASLLGFGEDSNCRLYVMTSDTAYRIAPNSAVKLADGSSGCPTTTPNEPSFKRLGLKVRAKRRQKLHGQIVVEATCSETCSMRAGGALLFFKHGSKRGSARLAPASRSAKAGKRTRFRLAILKVKVRKRAKQMLKQGQKVAAKVTVRATSEAGDTVRRTVHVKLRR